ncbi:hypothetical protein XI08_11610 [Bradyrhizobium sp. CCBAU 11361]|nr:hypothetical protein [Bradyrhizobium sp. CCBAU 11361]
MYIEILKMRCLMAESRRCGVTGAKLRIAIGRKLAANNKRFPRGLTATCQLLDWAPFALPRKISIMAASLGYG